MKADEPSGTFLFGEKQRFPRWLLLLVLGPLLMAVVLLLVQVSLHNVPISQFGIALAILVPVTVLVAYYCTVARLEKVVTSNGFYYRWMPFQKRYRYIEKERIGSVVRRTAPFLHYGFGFFLTYGWVHHINGAEGLQVYLESGKRLFFGARDAAGFQKAMRQLISSTPKYERREY